MISELEREKEFRQAAENRLKGDYHTATTTSYLSLPHTIHLKQIHSFMY